MEEGGSDTIVVMTRMTSFKLKVYIAMEPPTLGVA